MKCLSYIKLQTIKHTEAATKLFMVASCDQKLFGLQYISYFLILFSKSTAPPTRAPVAPPTDATAAVAVADKPAAPENKDRRKKKKKIIIIIIIIIIRLITAITELEWHRELGPVS